MANDHLTLDEITTQHDTMLDAVIAKSSDKIFDGLQEAGNYIRHCVIAAMRSLGIELHAKMPGGVVDDILKAKKVEIQQYKSKEHSGTYIYLDDELQYFISDIIIASSSSFIYFHKPKYIVRTNVQV